jgi:hypothetical protein
MSMKNSSDNPLAFSVVPEPTALHTQNTNNKNNNKNIDEVPSLEPYTLHTEQ